MFFLGKGLPESSPGYKIMNLIFKLNLDPCFSSMIVICQLQSFCNEQVTTFRRRKK